MREDPKVTDVITLIIIDMTEEPRHTYILVDSLGYYWTLNRPCLRHHVALCPAANKGLGG